MAKNDPKNETREETKIIFSNVPTSLTDLVYFASSNNGSILMQLISAIPDQLIENHRTVINAEYVNQFIETLCKVADYYPKKTKKKTSKKEKNT